VFFGLLCKTNASYYGHCRHCAGNLDPMERPPPGSLGHRISHRWSLRAFQYADGPSVQHMKTFFALTRDVFVRQSFGTVTEPFFVGQRAPPSHSCRFLPVTLLQSPPVAATGSYRFLPPCFYVPLCSFAHLKTVYKLGLHNTLFVGN